ncbi:MAG TPA: AAA family ATPase, partial [Candidatus Paceibacterota bacterium]|nr:AAA family ATPase [Candidatus Paceibacterota bacterium]
MKIKKISKIHNIFSYSFFNWDEMNPEHGENPNAPIDIFTKDNVIFAENGNGKSILVDILKSLDGQDIVLEKNWDRAEKDRQEIKIVFGDDSEINFDESGWSNENLKNNFVIFDEYFIEGFVHSIGPNYVDTPQRRQQRGRNIVYLGNFADYNNEVDRVNTLKNTIVEKNRLFLETEQAKITGILNKYGITTEELIAKKSKIQGLDKNNLQNKKDQFAKKQIELEKIEKAVGEKSKIEELPLLLEEKNRFSLKTEIFELGKKKEITLDPIELFYFTVSKGVQQTLHKIFHKKDFVKQGLSLLTDETTDCPFCEQKIKNGDYIQIIKNYQEIFDESFAMEEKRIQALLSIYKGTLEKLRDLQASSINQKSLNQVKPFVSIDEELPTLNIDDDDKVIVKAEIAVVLEKEKNILDKINGSNIDKVITVVEKANVLIESYNEIVSKVNKRIEQLKKDSLEGKLDIIKNKIVSERTQLEDEIFLIENKDSFEKYFESIDISKKNEKVIESLEKIFQALKNKIVDEFNEFVSDYFEIISSFVKEISPSMEILNILGQATYDRRNLRDPAQCGFCVKHNGKDCGGSLSKGEKQVIALAFFFAQLRKESNKNKIIVLDDPITSFDAGKRKSTVEVIQRETKNFEQIFIFTCDPLFREYCLKQLDNR